MIRLTLQDIAGAIDAPCSNPVPKIELTAISTDTRTIKRGELYVAIEGDQFDGHDYVLRAAQTGCPAVVISRPVMHIPVGCIPLMVEDTRVALGALARMVRDRVDPAVIAVTGSNGKTTTRQMIYHILKDDRPTVTAPGNYNNEIGLPKSLLEIEKDTRAAIVELGTSGPGEIARLAAIARPTIGVVTQVTATHLAGLKNERGVAEEKRALIEALGPDGLAVVNLDCPHAHRMLRAASGPVVTFGEAADAQFRAEAIRQTGTTLTFRINGVLFALPLIGRHNVQNALAAVAACSGLEIPLARCTERLRSFTAAPGRMELIEWEGRTLLNDGYNASPASVDAALRGLVAIDPSRETVAILGDMLELGPEARRYHAQVGRTVVDMGIDQLWTVGTDAEEIAAEAVRQGMKAERIRCFLHTADCVRSLPAIPDQALVLVKGSRAVGMERLVSVLLQGASPSPARPPVAVPAQG